ncbi:hypothetical protein RchiOBHm_Chr1g0381801 [Rosa chinensis]|uniref:Ion transport domain-containing protein n=1 Tax=Rosa chinensis TaxID=74649 RepID=A0A2P6SP73_ROSCH|nr:hypothetical protein RchiOBHm_Chr1g0381801 [Rosa chinensis]
MFVACSPHLNPATTEEQFTIENLPWSSAEIYNPYSSSFRPMWNYYISNGVCVRYFNGSFNLFLYVLVLNEDVKCIGGDKKLKKTALCLRSLTDIHYVYDIYFQIVFLLNTMRHDANRERRFLPLVKRIARAIWRSYILIDTLAVLPIPQVAILIFFTKMRGTKSLNTRNFLNSLVMVQYVARILRIYQIYKKIENKQPSSRETRIWVKGVFMFLFTSHVIGALWYFFSFQREIDCWRYVCRVENGCELRTFNCAQDHSFQNVQFLNDLCPISSPNTTLTNFGIFLDTSIWYIRVNRFSAKKIVLFLV